MLGMSENFTYDVIRARGHVVDEYRSRAAVCYRNESNGSQAGHRASPSDHAAVGKQDAESQSVRSATLETSRICSSMDRYGRKRNL